ncbi:MAG: hypothetical protein ACFFG0_18205 [Candidatus Thorarchaeota archaeon]
MKFKKHLIVPFFLCFFLTMIFSVQNVKAQTGIYEKRTNPSNPFIFTTDTIYLPSSQNLTTNNVETFYHQVLLQNNEFYLLYICEGPVSMDNWELSFYYSGDDSIDYFEEFFAFTSGVLYLLLLRPTITGYFNLTLIGGTLGHHITLGFSGIGFLKLPNMNLNQLFSRDYWDFDSNSIVAGKLNLESGNYIVAIDDGIMNYFPDASVYYENLITVSQFERLSENIYTQIDCSKDHKTYLSTGSYIFFSLEGAEFGLMNAPSQVPKVISGYPLLLLMGFISIVSIMIIKKKFKK